MKRLFVLSLALSACPAPEPIAPGIFGKLGEIRPSATEAERATFVRGQAVAQKRYTPATGLGPEMNVSFCGACHEKPVLGGSAGRYRAFQLVGQKLSDGSFQFLGKSGVMPHFDLATSGRTPTPAGVNVTATRNPIPFFGVGLLAEIPDAELLKNADPDDKNKDGISGKANYDRGFVGRFGRKSQTVSIEGFIRGPLFNHVGLTSNPLSEEARAKLPVPSNSVMTLKDGLEGEGVIRQAQAAAPDEPTTDNDGAPDPELSESELFDLVSFSMLLAAPQPDEVTADVSAGQTAFSKAQCTACHLPTLKGPRGLIPAYSDLLLHDMGEELADGIEMKTATGAEFRTQPLWGVSAVGPYLHDGRADTIDEAIRLHAGEAKASRDAYVALSEGERAKLIVFVESLGGKSQHSTGLVSPEAPIPAAGTFGGPAVELTGTDATKFLTGRELFDRDFARSAGLGPSFNGDSCRACHFDPVIGGAGPRDVDVIRQGIIATDLSFTAPPAGTMVHRLQTNLTKRPEPSPMANFFEHRQPPPAFGLGLLERVSDSEITRREDPNDTNGDGIKGRANRLSDGRIGRLGWKANVPNLAEFSRDALFNELGLTLPMQSGLSFGAMTDSDSVADPELTVAQVEALTFFMASLAPPPRTRKDMAQEDRGQALFGAAKCDACHVPSLPTSDGKMANAYTDLLLHEIVPNTTKGIGDAARPREFRTTPLWGVSKTGPYLHDGSAADVRAAIVAHQGEANASRLAFEAMPAADQAAVLAFLDSL